MLPAVQHAVACRVKHYSYAAQSIELLVAAGIPAFVQKENIGGVFFAALPSPASGPGIDYNVIVPLSRAESAVALLAEFPPATPPDDTGPWGFIENPRIRKGWRVYAIICIMGDLLYLCYWAGVSLSVLLKF